MCRFKLVSRGEPGVAAKPCSLNAARRPDSRGLAVQRRQTTFEFSLPTSWTGSHPEVHPWLLTPFQPRIFNRNYMLCLYILFFLSDIYSPYQKKRIFLLKKEIFSCFYSEIRPKKYSIQLPVLILISIYPSVHVLVRIKALILDLFLFTDLFLFFFLPIIYNYNNFLNRNVHF